MKSPKFMGKERVMDLTSHTLSLPPPTHTHYSYGSNNYRTKAVMWIDTISNRTEGWIIAINPTSF